MVLEIDVGNVKLLEELSPRGACEAFVSERKGKAILVTKENFDEMVGRGDFSVGPFKDKFGDGPGEPYNPNRQAFGIAKDGKAYYCELTPSLNEKAKEYLEK